MTTVQIELSDATAQAARDAGLLRAEAIEALLQDALIRREAAQTWLAIADRAESPPMSMEAIDAEVKADRREQQRASSR